MPLLAPHNISCNMEISALPFEIAALSTTTYILLLRVLRSSNVFGLCSVQGPVKVISSAHAAVSSLLAVYALRSSQWYRFPSPSARFSSRKPPTLTGDGDLDDSANPLIQRRSAVLNALTAWEAGYLIYDTYALVTSLRVSHQPTIKLGLVGAVFRLARVSPAILAHHVLLAAALLYLQVVIARNRERGVWVIVAFMLMNASTPVLHARWWAKRSGRDMLAHVLEVILVVSFAVTRFGAIAWVLKCYGGYHGLGPWEVYKRFRPQCQAGTAALVAFNGLWWFIIVKQLVKRTRGASRCSH